MPNGYSDAVRGFTKMLNHHLQHFESEVLFLSYLLMTAIRKEELGVNVWKMCIKL